MGALRRHQRRLLQRRRGLSGTSAAAAELRRRGKRGRGQPLIAVALIGAAAAGAAIALRFVAPFEHGSWLIAYLVLVGALAPYLLAAGLDRLGVDADRRGRLEAAAWLAAVVMVPAGVLLDARLAVVAGSAALLAALVSIARRTPADVAARHRLAHDAIIAFMALSTFVGIGLAWSRPWL